MAAPEEAPQRPLLPSARSYPCLAVLRPPSPPLFVQPAAELHDGSSILTDAGPAADGDMSSLSFFLLDADASTGHHHRAPGASSSRVSSRSPSPCSNRPATTATTVTSVDQASVEGTGFESGSAGSVRSSDVGGMSRNESINSKHGGSGGGGRVKRKSAWYQMLNPTYRSRCEDFRRIFKDLPVEERLIVDYSCALQRDILLQGRIYVTQNFLCFYANIFRWETLVQLRWKDVSALTKEKTALVIPNAIQICTTGGPDASGGGEKHFFCSFGARDKTYVVLFRTWQQALLDQPLGNQELWKFVHSVYGGDLGFSSNEENSSVVSNNSSGLLPASAGIPLEAIPAAAAPSNASQSPSPSLHSAQTSNDDDLSYVQHRFHQVTSCPLVGRLFPSAGLRRTDGQQLRFRHVQQQQQQKELRVRLSARPSARLHFDDGQWRRSGAGRSVHR